MGQRFPQSKHPAMKDEPIQPTPVDTIPNKILKFFAIEGIAWIMQVSPGHAYPC